MKIAKNITEIIGNTPVLHLSAFMPNLYGKCEFLNPSHSVKDRPAFGMIEEALQSGKIDKNSTIVECTSGNMGVSLAMICASLGLKLIITMPESMSVERRKMISFFGAKLELTPAAEGILGARNRAKEIIANTPNAFEIDQFSNMANKQKHRSTTALEIYDTFGGKLDYFVAGFGTGGTISGVGEVLKEKIANLKAIGVEPEASPFVSKGVAGTHKIQGIGASFMPEIFNRDIVDEIRTVSDEDAINTAKKLGKHGIMVGISSGANVYIATQVAKENPQSIVLTMLNDTAERYISTDLFANL